MAGTGWRYSRPLRSAAGAQIARPDGRSAPAINSDRHPASQSQLDFWFAIGSTYTYLTVMRVSYSACSSGIAVNWRPFSLRILTREMNNVPFATKPFKAKYLSRDSERRCTSRMKTL